MGRGPGGRGLRETGLRRPSTRGRSTSRGREGGLGRLVATVEDEVGACGGGAWAWSGRSQGTGLSCGCSAGAGEIKAQCPASWSLERFGECWLLSPLPGAARLPGAGVLSLLRGCSCFEEVVGRGRTGDLGGGSFVAFWLAQACTGKQGSWKPCRGPNPELEPRPGRPSEPGRTESLRPDEPRPDTDPRAWRTGRAGEQKAEPGGRVVRDLPEHRRSGARAGLEGDEPVGE